MAVLEGKVWRYGDNIDTDVIIPARYLNTFDPKELSKHCMVDIDPTFAENVKAGDIMVGGKNFGWARTCACRHQSKRCTRRHCGVFRPYFLQKRHQCRSAASGDRR